MNTQVLFIAILAVAIGSAVGGTEAHSILEVVKQESSIERVEKEDNLQVWLQTRLQMFLLLFFCRKFLLMTSKLAKQLKKRKMKHLPESHAL